jgi:large subunit ribosomal protein L22
MAKETVQDEKEVVFRSCHRHARISARKVRPIADMIRGLYADEALDVLKYQPQRGARMLEKVLRSALGNAQDPDQSRGRNVNIKNLVVMEARVDGGPMFKRIRPRARGSAYLVRKRTSHIHITLEELD